jgi:hypothetical protein
MINIASLLSLEPWFMIRVTLFFYIVFIVIGAIATTKEWTSNQTRKPSYLPFYGKVIRSFTSFCVFQFMLVRLVLFALLLLPAFLRIGWWYARSDDIVHSVPFGDGKLRQNLDIYLPSNKGTKKSKLPVLFFTGGGAWVVGHKAFCALLGRIFMNQGIIVVSPDYRQYPQVTVNDMLSDIDSAIQWTFDHIDIYGGDVNKIFIAGQSAGAHLTSTLVLEHASSELKERHGGGGSSGTRMRSKFGLGTISEEEEMTDATPNKNKQEISGGSRDLILQPWKCSQVAGYVGISGPYQLVHLREHLFDRGIEQLSFLTHLIGGKKVSVRVVLLIFL